MGIMGKWVVVESSAPRTLRDTRPSRWEHAVGEKYFLRSLQDYMLVVRSRPTGLCCGAPAFLARPVWLSLGKLGRAKSPCKCAVHCTPNPRRFLPGLLQNVRHD